MATGEIVKERLKIVLKYNGINAKDITPSLINPGSEWKLESEINRSNPTMLAKNVSARIIGFLVSHDAVFSSEYLYGDTADYGEMPKAKSTTKKTKKASKPAYKKPVKPQYRSEDGRCNRSEIDIDMTENKCNTDRINGRIKELGLKKSFINYWFSNTNPNTLYDYIHKNVKSIRKADQQTLAYFLEGSIFNLTTGYSKIDEDSIADFTPTRFSIYYLNPDEVLALNDTEIATFIKKLGITNHIYKDMVNQIVLIPELAANEMLSVYNLLTNQSLEFDQLFIKTSNKELVEDAKITEAKITETKRKYPEGFGKYYSKYMNGTMTVVQIAEEIGCHFTSVYKYMDYYDEERVKMGFEPYGRKKKNRTKSQDKKSKMKGGFKKPEAGEVIDARDKSSLIPDTMKSATVLTNDAESLIQFVLNNANDLTSDQLFALADYLKSVGIQKLNEEKVKKLIRKKQ